MNNTFSYAIVAAIFIMTGIGSPLPKKHKYLTNPAVQRFREYVQLETITSKEENIELAVKFWRRQAKELGLEFVVLRPLGKPICILTYRGMQPNLPSIMLNSHMDVVPVEKEFWTYPPFSAYLDDNGDIWGRGTQDDKDVAIQYLEAIRRFKQNNITLKRTLHMTLMPDEETGGSQGMTPFVETNEFQALNVGMALDEGLASTSNTIYATYVDVRPWQIKITVQGSSGHAGTTPGNVAIEKLQNIINQINDYRKAQKSFSKGGLADSGAYDNVNINIVQGGFVPNVIPGKISLVVDIRLAVNRSVQEMQQLVNGWIALGGNGTKVEYIRRLEVSDASPLESNIYWNTLQKAVTDMGYILEPIVCPATSDMTKIRALGIPAFGFSPKTNTVSRIHDHNEYLNAETFLQGIEIYVGILLKLGNLSPYE